MKKQSFDSLRGLITQNSFWAQEEYQKGPTFFLKKPLFAKKCIFLQNGGTKVKNRCFRAREREKQFQ